MICLPLTGTHSLTSLRLRTTGGSTLPEHIAVGMVDDVQYYSYSSAEGEPVPLFDWVSTPEGREFWDKRAFYIVSGHNLWKWRVSNIVQHFNHTGVHFFQHVSRCELGEDGSRRVQVYQAYDGKDFAGLDVETMTWVAAVPQAVFYKRNWEAHPARQEFVSHYYREDCFELLKMFLKYGKETLQRKVHPEVRVIERTGPRSAGTELLCHVTGFYPQNVSVSWVRDGTAVLQEGLWRGEVLPNGDGTYQLRKTLTVSAEERGTHSYSCRVEHSSLEEAVCVKWGETRGQSWAAEMPVTVLTAACAEQLSALCFRPAGGSAHRRCHCWSPGCCSASDRRLYWSRLEEESSR
ncbi:HMR1 protein, partial [Amia calva]|nr:HMR1 protein [Amia calva]